MISIVLPVYNEELILKDSVLKLFYFCQKKIAAEWQIIIADNASTDTTSQIALELSQNYPQIKYFFTPLKGKGSGVIQAWQNFNSSVYVFMDVDLSTRLDSLPQLISYIHSGYDIAIGSRFVHGSKVERSLSRKFFSLGLRFLLKILFNLKVKDAPCGFKAVNQKVVNLILPHIQNRTWFFDTEMLVLAQKNNFKIKEIPVVWHEKNFSGRQSKVSARQVIRDYLRNIYSLHKRL